MCKPIDEFLQEMHIRSNNSMCVSLKLPWNAIFDIQTTFCKHNSPINNPFKLHKSIKFID